MLTDYLTTQEVREAIGIEDDELSDTSLALPMYETELGIALSLVGTTGTLQQDYATIAAKDPTVRTATESALYSQTRLYAVYTTGLAVLPSLPLRAMKGESDEKADYTRFGGNVHDQVAERLSAAAARVLVALGKTYDSFNQVDATSTVRTYFTSASPSYDPITG